MQLHQPTSTPTALALHRQHQQRERQIKAAAYEKKLTVVAQEMVEPEWPAPAPYPKRQWFFIEFELPTKYPPVSKIQKIVANHYHITQADILSKRRTSDVINPRHIAMYLAKELTPRSTVDIGRRFNRDHSSVIHGIRRIRELCISHAEIAHDVAHLEQKFA